MWQESPSENLAFEWKFTKVLKESTEPGFPSSAKSGSRMSWGHLESTRKDHVVVAKGLKGEWRVGDKG